MLDRDGTHLSPPPRISRATQPLSLQIDSGSPSVGDPLSTDAPRPSGLGLGLLSGFQATSAPSSSRLGPPPVISGPMVMPAFSERSPARSSRPLSGYSSTGVISAPKAEDLDKFAKQCRAMFEGDQQAAKLVEQTMRNLPAGSKARQVWARAHAKWCH